MPCLMLIFAFISPRIVLVVLWLFGYTQKAFTTALWPILGFIFAPVTTLAYAWAMNSHGSIEGIYLAAVVLGALIDVGLIGGGASRRKKKD